MSITNPATLELLMQQRVADRLHEAEQERIVTAARRSSTSVRTSHPILATAVAFTRLLSSIL